MRLHYQGRFRLFFRSAGAGDKRWSIAMSLSQQPNMASVQAALKSAVREHFTLFLTEGIVLLVLGTLAILLPMFATIAATIILGWLFLISGILGLVVTFGARGAPGFWWSLLSAVLATAAG